MPHDELSEITRSATVERQVPEVSPERLDGTDTATPLSRSPGRLLRHPLFLSSLLLLVLNDHLLKHSLPGLLTGKLSDFAGLIVAPISLVALFGARSPLARLTCFVLVALVFGAINVSVDAARLFEGATALAGIPWSVFVDPSDLIALAVMPIAWRIAATGVEERTALDRVTLAFAAIACAASSPQEQWSTGAYVINRTESELSVHLRWAEADLDCDAITGRGAEVFAPSVFGPATTFVLEKNRSVPLERTGEPRRCDAVLVRTGSLPPRVVFFSDRPLTSVPLFVDEEDDDDLEFDTSGMLVIEQARGRAIALRAGSGLEMSDLLEEAPEPACAQREIPRFGWSSFPASLETTLVEVAAGADGCLLLDLGADERRYLCVPAAEFPFATGDRVAIASEELPAGRALRITNERAELSVWSGSLEGSGLGAEPMDRDACGRRLPCGSYAVSVALDLEDGSRIAPGIALETTDGARERRMVLGTAEHFLVGAEGCEQGQDAAGYAIDLLIVEREVN